ncbi:DHA2 family efflux MFS transporter permease subunit [Ligilactobacillus pobuzihii]|uniref:Transport protein n=1 Tax=Ligilactobacillus pobuzihii TaxID=449659 RepID=A0A0R2LIK0_9LACO|nr:DHA2 family efflux MFS transporter permease subunit [Ligilactobacillus pobuzihii]KRK09339.1 transport protein [Ligilactobacillus pobuzihii E100301 = KCTC 13174]KRN98509.1 transport protein [Ligilactobacillus pobuzihii]GEN48535.1 MFS transporter [Ligilactobacillus pobuzihii]
MSKKLNINLIFAIVATGLMSFCGVLIETAGNITFPVLMREFHVNLATVQWMTTGYLLIASVIMPLSAFLKKNFSSKSLFIIAVLLFLSGLIIDASATNFALLVSGRVIQGAAAGIALPLMFNIILEQAPTNQRGLLMGIGTMITAIAPALGPTFGGLVVNSLGWRYIFILIIPVIIIFFILGSIFISKNSDVKPHTKLDLPGFISIALTFSGLILAFSNLSAIQKKPLSFIFPFLIGIIFLVFFIKHSLTTKKPLINIRLFKKTRFTQGISAYFLFQINTLGLSFILPNYIQLVNGSTAMTAGLLVLPGGALGAILAPVSGRLLDNYGARKPILTGAVFELVGSLLFFIFASKLSSLLIIIFYLIIMLGVGLVMGNIMTTSLNLITVDQNADGNGLFNMAQQFSGAVGTSIISAIMQFVQQISTASSTAGRTTAGAQVALFFLFILVLFAVYLLYQATKKIDLVKE